MFLVTSSLLFLVAGTPRALRTRVLQLNVPIKPGQVVGALQIREDYVSTIEMPPSILCN